MQFSQLDKDGVTIISLSGRIDAGTSEPFKAKLMAAIGDRPVRLVLDFAHVDFISSIGLRVLIVAAKRVAAVHGKMAFSGLQGPVREVFELAGFVSVAPFFPDRDAAAASLS
jgi:anti-sigma B factor antagonist